MTESMYSPFPSLHAKAIQLDTDISQLRSQIKELETTERYADNESERDYQLAKLEEKREQILEGAEQDFQFELEAIELQHAEQAFALPEASEEEYEQARNVAETIKTQLVTSININDTLSLLVLRTKSMSDLEKETFRSDLLSIKDSLLSKARNDFERAEMKANINEIMKNINDTAFNRDFTEQREALYKIKIGGDSISRKHIAFDRAFKGMRDRVFNKPQKKY